MELRWTQSTRRHRIGRAHARFVMGSVQLDVGVRPSGETELTWVGSDDRGVELTVIAAVTVDGVVLVLHVQPMYR